MLPDGDADVLDLLQHVESLDVLGVGVYELPLDDLQLVAEGLHHRLGLHHCLGHLGHIVADLGELRCLGDLLVGRADFLLRHHDRAHARLQRGHLADEDVHLLSAGVLEGLGLLAASSQRA